MRPTAGVSTIKPVRVGGGLERVMCVCVPLTRCRRACEADGGRIYHKAGAGGGRPGGVMCVCVPLTPARRCRRASLQ